MFVRIAFFIVATALSLSSSLLAQSPVDGRWNFSMTSPFGQVAAIVDLQTSGETLTGQFDMGGGRIWPINDGTVSGNTINFNVVRDGANATYQMTATIDGNQANGIATAMGSTAGWSMTRAD